MNPLKGLKLPSFSKWSRREQLIAAGCMGVVLLVAMDRLVVASWWHHMVNFREEIDRSEHSLVTQQRLLDRKDSLLTDEQKYQEYLRPGAASELQMATLLKEIENLAHQAQVSLEEVKPLTSEESDLSQTYVFEVHSESSLDQWVRFVHLVETSHTLFKVQRAKLEKKEDKQDLLKGYLRLTALAIR